jgi:hypothetical protein
LKNKKEKRKHNQQRTDDFCEVTSLFESHFAPPHNACVCDQKEIGNSAQYVRFGSLAAFSNKSSRMSAFGVKADVQDGQISGKSASAFGH